MATRLAIITTKTPMISIRVAGAINFFTLRGVFNRSCKPYTA